MNCGTQQSYSFAKLMQSLSLLTDCPWHVLLNEQVLNVEQYERK